MFEFLEERAHATPNIAFHRGFGELIVEVRSGETRRFVCIDEAGVTVSPAAPVRAPDLVFSASAESWQELFSPAPRPGFQTLSAMRRTGHLEVTGDFLQFHRNLLLLELLFSLTEAPEPAAPVGTPVLEPVVGRYLRLDIGGRPHRLYFEEAGRGIPLICLHTAGADGRQFRALLNDADITERFRVIAFDLPWHGKSSPPPGFEAEVYRLTTDGYVEIVMALTRALGLADPVVMGCSIGGRAVLHLALRHGDELRAVIGLQSALYAEVRSGQEAEPLDPLHRPDVHGGKTAGASMAGLTAPQSPSAERWETMWHYMQGGPGVFLGDLHYYFTDGDLRNGLAAGLDTAKCPVYLLSGEYDISATPEMGRALAEEIGATHFEVMPEMGHFPMSENPDAFRRYLLPVLDAIASSG